MNKIIVKKDIFSILISHLIKSICNMNGVEQLLAF